MKHSINITLEDNWNIDQSKRYNQILEMTILYIKCRFLFIAFFNPNTMINVFDINLNKELYSYNPV